MAAWPTRSTCGNSKKASRHGTCGDEQIFTEHSRTSVERTLLGRTCMGQSSVKRTSVGLTSLGRISPRHTSASLTLAEQTSAVQTLGERISLGQTSGEQASAKHNLLTHCFPRRSWVMSISVALKGSMWSSIEAPQQSE